LEEELKRVAGKCSPAARSKGQAGFRPAAELSGCLLGCTRAAALWWMPNDGKMCQVFPVKLMVATACSGYASCRQIRGRSVELWSAALYGAGE
jgi:hypothetical protein